MSLRKAAITLAAALPKGNPLRKDLLNILKTAYGNVFELEKDDFGIVEGHYGFSVYYPIENIGKRGKIVTVREVYVRDDRTAWPATLLDRAKNAANAVAVNKLVDELIIEAKNSPSIMKDREGKPVITDYTHTMKGVDMSLPTPKSHMVEDIKGADITVDLSSKPIKVYSKSEGKMLGEMNMTYYFEINPAFKRKLQALAEELKAADSLEAVQKLLKANNITWKYHSYMEPGFD